MEIEDTDIELIEPSAASLVESLRSIGYTLETAIADLIDNSITANATIIDIDSPFCASDTKIFILDNGFGMTEERLIEAMRLGSYSPSKTRSEKDLGRFGLGLKTATFSQCKKLSVVTKKDGVISARCWDLDFVISQNKWCLQKQVPQSYINKLSQYESGTLVVWEKLDRVISDKDNSAEKHFNNKKELLRRHLSLTFHRFIERQKLSINIGGVPVQPWNPFLPSKSSSLKKEIPPITLCNGNVRIRGMVMPHRNFFTDAEYKDAGFRRGWTQMQGFYIYRGDRLLTAGGWLGLKLDGSSMLQEHHYDLGRICVDITNGYDFDWDIDIKKSKATPPSYLRDILAKIAKQIRKMAYETYSYRGSKQPPKRQQGKQYLPLWNSVSERNGKLFYSINTEHPYVTEILESLDETNALKVKRLLKVMAETIPVESIGFESTKEHAKRFSSPFESEDKELEDVKKEMVDSMKKKGFSEEDALEQIDFILNL